MCPRPLSELKRASSGGESEKDSADQLLRLLVGLALKRECVEPDENRDENEEILVDAELDGFRYLLVRLPRQTSSRVTLSPREQEIVRMVAHGHPNKVIAGVLNISGWTVCTHLRRIFAKLGVGSRAAMVARLLDMGSLDNRIRRSQEVSGAARSATSGAAPEARFQEKPAVRSGQREIPKSTKEK